MNLNNLIIFMRSFLSSTYLFTHESETNNIFWFFYEECKSFLITKQIFTLDKKNK